VGVGHAAGSAGERLESREQKGWHGIKRRPFFRAAAKGGGKKKAEWLLKPTPPAFARAALV
jgi:hypothetical protein